MHFVGRVDSIHIISSAGLRSACISSLYYPFSFLHVNRIPIPPHHHHQSFTQSQPLDLYPSLNPPRD
jgi:hypothetical protein